MSHLMNTYARLPVAFARGEGVWLWDTEGRRYLDGVAGVAVNTLGHAHPKLTQAICEQAKSLIHSSNLYQIPLQEKLADKLCEISAMDNVFFCNSGCEANEAAIKLARLYGHQKGVEVPTIVVMDKSFHGRTMATLTATGSRKVQAGFEPLLAGFARVPYNDVEAVRQAAAHNKNIVALLVEPVQGEGGINIPDADYLGALRKICDDNGWLFMLDEVQSGIGRAPGFGINICDQTRCDDAWPKAWAAACRSAPVSRAARRPRLFKPGNHGSTFGGSPLACTAALTTLQAIEDEGLRENASRIGQFIVNSFKQAFAGMAGVTQVRGHGLMIGIELDRPCTDLVKRALAQGFIINVTSDKVIRLVPPLIMNEQEASQLIAGVVPLVKEFLAQAV